MNRPRKHWFNRNLIRDALGWSYEPKPLPIVRSPGKTKRKHEGRK